MKTTLITTAQFEFYAIHNESPSASARVVMPYFLNGKPPIYSGMLWSLYPGDVILPAYTSYISAISISGNFQWVDASVVFPVGMEFCIYGMSIHGADDPDTWETALSVSSPMYSMKHAAEDALTYIVHPHNDNLTGEEDVLNSIVFNAAYRNAMIEDANGYLRRLLSGER